MKRFPLLLVIVVGAFATAFPGTALAEEVAPNTGPAPGVYPGTEPVPGAPAGTCSAEPTASRCPSVSEIVILPPIVNGEGTPGYGPKLTPLTPAAGADACEVHVSAGPNRDFEQVHMTAENYCLPGVGVEETELSAGLWKLQENGNEQLRGNDRVHGWGGGTLFAEHNASCGTPHINFRWRAFAYANAEVNGILYGQGESKYATLACN